MKLNSTLDEIRKVAGRQQNSKVTHSLMLCSLIVLLVGCAQIPPESIQLNREVSKSISTLKTNIVQLVDAWEKARYSLIDAEWSDYYGKATEDYNSRTQERRAELEVDAPAEENIGELAAIYSNEDKATISKQARVMRLQLEIITQKIAVANDSITHLLMSADSVGKIRTVVVDEFNAVSAVDISNLTEEANSTEDTEVTTGDEN